MHMHPTACVEPNMYSANARAASDKRPTHPGKPGTHTRESQLPALDVAWHTTQAHKCVRASLAHGRIRRAHTPPRAAPLCESHATMQEPPRTIDTSLCWALPTVHRAGSQNPASALPPARSRAAVPLHLHKEPPPPPSAVPLRAVCPHHKPTTSRIGNKQSPRNAET
eukprot:4949560-Prymnesium_polylepis.1